MLKRLHLKNFTVFADADFEFVQGLNVLVGTNGTGKSHVLKAGYAIAYSATSIIHDEYLVQDAHNWRNQVSRGFQELFRPKRIGELVRWGANEAEVTTQYVGPEVGSVKLRFVSAAQTPVVIGKQPIEVEEFLPAEYDLLGPVFIPAKEVLTLSWMVPADNQLKLSIDSSYLHLLNQLRGILRRQPEAPEAILKITEILGGELKEEGDNYYLVQSDGQRLEAGMMAEGLRKFGTLQKLLANGSLTKNTTLYWDEPESNLNPALLRKLAAILAELASQGFQIILATHSMSLLKEFHILSRQKDAKEFKIKYFGLNAGPGEATRVVTTDNFEYLPDVVALAEELKQADELEEVFIRDDQAYHAQHSGDE